MCEFLFELETRMENGRLWVDPWIHGTDNQKRTIPWGVHHRPTNFDDKYFTLGHYDHPPAQIYLYIFPCIFICVNIHLYIPAKHNNVT